ncbi:unnamed protein product [Larinioides sclopetarius]|uniref:Uncharacterized protein n=1 Tax=Larinioides sclopetarius TaxID=280406 RepID=A0AAV1ZDS1_9ARAC
MNSPIRRPINVVARFLSKSPRAYRQHLRFCSGPSQSPVHLDRLQSHLNSHRYSKYIVWWGNRKGRLFQKKRLPATRRATNPWLA